jgi:hypothetical protein
LPNLGVGDPTTDLVEPGPVHTTQALDVIKRVNPPRACWLDFVPGGIVHRAAKHTDAAAEVVPQVADAGTWNPKQEWRAAIHASIPVVLDRKRPMA